MLKNLAPGTNEEKKQRKWARHQSEFLISRKRGEKERCSTSSSSKKKRGDIEKGKKKKKREEYKGKRQAKMPYWVSEHPCLLHHSEWLSDDSTQVSTLATLFHK